ncbi:hypothetical protein HQ586_09965 [Candidatus Bathyarchaeota archaeon]|nr:hypothetical protein [Candidatus Bathyarchaeota archaeon]
MKATRRNTHTYSGDEPGIVGYNLQVDIHGIKLWATANLPATSHLRGILLLEKDILTAAEFLAKMDIWLKLIKLEGNSLN